MSATQIIRRYTIDPIIVAVKTVLIAIALIFVISIEVYVFIFDFIRGKVIEEMRAFVP